jgi:futalosine hydrolase
MYLVTAATPFELAPFRSACNLSGRVEELVCGIGPVEAAVRLGVYLSQTRQQIRAVVNLGIAGAYVRQSGGAGVLDLCLAEREVLGDLGICQGDRIEPLRGAHLEVEDAFVLDPVLLATARAHFDRMGMGCHVGTFLTVNAASGTRSRGDAIARPHQALCENMEGAALARVCREFSLPFLELRCISNMVEDRHLQQWQLKKACNQCGEAAALLMNELLHD